MNKFVNIGFSNLVLDERVLCVLSPDSLPCKRLIADARENKLLIDCTFGRKTRAVLLLDNQCVILCGLNTETISARLNGGEEKPEE